MIIALYVNYTVNFDNSEHHTAVTTVRHDSDVTILEQYLMVALKAAQMVVLVDWWVDNLVDD